MTDLTKIEFFIEDKNVGAVSRVVNTFKVFNFTSVPVVNATTTKAGTIAAETGGSVVEMVSRSLAASMKDEFAPGEIADFVVAAGKARKSYTYVIGKLVEAKLLRRSGKGQKTRYHLVQKKEGK